MAVACDHIIKNAKHTNCFYSLLHFIFKSFANSNNYTSSIWSAYYLHSLLATPIYGSVLIWTKLNKVKFDFSWNQTEMEIGMEIWIQDPWKVLFWIVLQKVFLIRRPFISIRKNSKVFEQKGDLLNFKANIDPMAMLSRVKPGWAKWSQAEVS